MTKYSLYERIERRVTKKEFLNAQRAEATSNGVPRAQLIKNKVFTKTEIIRLVRDKKLVPIKYRSRIYFKREHVLSCLFAISSKKPIMTLWES
jgi:hypothetical protein